MSSSLPHIPSSSAAGSTAGTDDHGDALCVVGDGQDLAFAVSLADAGHRVVLLNTADQPVDHAATVPVRVVSLADLFHPSHGYAPLRSLLVSHWLRKRRFQHVLFRQPAAAYYTALARDLGLGPADTALWIMGTECSAVRLGRQRAFPQGRTQIELQFIEAEALRRVDGLLLDAREDEHVLTDADMPLPPRRLTWTGSVHALPLAPGSRIAGAAPANIRISVCLPTFNRADELRDAAESLLTQDADDFEVVLVDDGSTDPAALAMIEDLRPRFDQRGWTILRQDNAGPAQARRAARRVANGTHLLFMDDDNIALRDEIQRFTTAARGGADILTCIPGRHPASDLGPAVVATIDSTDPRFPRVGIDWTPVGACPSLAVMVNCLGDNNALIRADVYDALGGHVGDRDFVLEDFHFLSLAVARGYRLEVVPEVLFLYRRHRQSRSMGAHLYSSHRRSLEPWLALVPPALHPLLLQARGDWYERHRAAAIAPDEQA